MVEYISREDALLHSEIIQIYSKDYGNIDVVPVEYLADIPAANVQPVDRWVDAQKNPPPIVDKRSMTSESVLILIDSGRCAVAYYCYDDEDGNCWVTDDEKTMYDLEEVTYWQPLPDKVGDMND